MGRIVIACYRAKPGKEQALEELMDTHLPTLRSEGLVTERKPILMRSEDGTFVEVFEWKSKEAIECAHQNETVGKMWQAFDDVCEFVPIASVKEASQMFSEFGAVDA